MRGVTHIRRVYIAASVLSILLGACLILQPELSVQIIVLAAGILIGVCGIVKIFGYFFQDPYRLAFQFDFGTGIIMLLAGLLIALFPTRAAAVLPLALGCVLLLDGALRLQTAIDAKRFGITSWYWLLILSLVTMACSIVLILRPFRGAEALTVLMGVCLICDGVQNLYSVLRTVRKAP